MTDCGTSEEHQLLPKLEKIRLDNSTVEVNTTAASATDNSEAEVLRKALLEVVQKNEELEAEKTQHM